MINISPQTVLAMHRIIHSALEQAVKWQLIIRNVANAIEPPKSKRYDAKFYELLEKNNFPIVRLHDLRHSHASLLVKMGIQPKEIFYRLGYSNIWITMDLYSHLYEETYQEVANMFDKLIKAN